MHSLTKLIRIVCILYAILLLSMNGCKKSEETALERTERLLTSATWKLNKLTVDGTDRTALYPGMELTASPGTYSCLNGEPVWPSSGAWQLMDEMTIDRDNGMIIRIEQLDESQLTLSLGWTKTTYGRTVSIRGQHVFEMTRK